MRFRYRPPPVHPGDGAALEGVKRLEFKPHAVSVRLLHADLGQAAEAFVGTLDDPALRGMAVLPPTARDVAEAGIHTDPARFLARRGISRGLVALRLGCSVTEVAIGHNERGAPKLLRPDSEPSGSQVWIACEPEGARGAPLHLSVSARQDLFAFALSPRRIGIDLEPGGEVVEPPWNVLSAAERKRLRGLEAGAAHRAFLEIWTAREAFLKADGRGLLVQVENTQWSKADVRHGWTDIDTTPCIVACAQLPVN